MPVDRDAVRVRDAGSRAGGVAGSNIAASCSSSRRRGRRLAFAERPRHAAAARRHGHRGTGRRVDAARKSPAALQRVPVDLVSRANVACRCHADGGAGSALRPMGGAVRVRRCDGATVRGCERSPDASPYCRVVRMRLQQWRSGTAAAASSRDDIPRRTGAGHPRRRAHAAAVHPSRASGRRRPRYATRSSRSQNARSMTLVMRMRSTCVHRRILGLSPMNTMRVSGSFARTLLTNLSASTTTCSDILPPPISLSPAYTTTSRG